MLDADETRELRALQSRAYGRDGGLTEADAARLAALDQKRAAAGVEEADDAEGRDPDPAAEATGAVAGEPVQQSELEPEPGRDPERPSGAESLSARRALRGHWRGLAFAAAGLLVIGLGAGWALFGRDDEGVPLSADEQQRGVELQTAGDYDPGSIEAIGRDDDAIVWFGTKKNGEMECIVLDAAGQSSSGCQIAADPQRSYGLSAVVMDSRRVEEGSGEQISATASRSHTGEMVALIQRWDVGVADWVHQFDPSEQERAQELLDRGYEPYSLTVMGYAGAAPVWSATRTEEFLTKQCLIVDAVEATQCVDANTGMIPGEGVRVAGTTVDDADQRTTSWSITLDFTPAGRPYLIVEGALPGGAGSEGTATGTISVRPGETLEVGGEHGDPIPIDVPSGDAG